MDSPLLVDHQLGVFERTHTWMSLRLLPELDLEDFLAGSRHAYVVTSELLQAGEWDKLGELVHPDVLVGMSKTFAEGGHPYVHGPFGAPDGHINILSAVLAGARTSGEDADVAHLEVKFRALQGVTLPDLQFGDELHTLPRLQESTWCFEGVRFRASHLSESSAAEGAEGDAAAAGVAAKGAAAEGEGASAADQIDWQVTDIKWSVWEMADPSRAQN